MKKALFLAGSLLLAVATANADQIVKPHTFTAGTPAQAEEVNANFDTVFGQVNKVGAAITVDQASGNVGVGMATPTARLDVQGPDPADSYGNWLPYDAYYTPCEHCADTCNGLDDDCNEVVDDGLEGAQGCTPYYPDQDADGRGDENNSGVCFCPSQQPQGYVTNNDDCRDNNADVKPAAVFHDTKIPGLPIFQTDWDWNCDGTWEKEYPSIWVSCPDGVYGCASGGWVSQVPACGQSAEFQPCDGTWNSGSGWVCYTAAGIQQIQKCR